MEELVRCFIAIELPDELKAELDRLVAKLKSNEQNFVKWVDPHDIHLTLKFLGGVPATQIGEITRVMGEAAGAAAPFRLEAVGLGVFPNPRRVQVAWVGIAGDVDKLVELQKDLESRLTRIGFAPENRPFVSHLTLARLRDHASLEDRQTFGQLILSTKFETPRVINVEAISLMRSQLTRQGAIYSRIALAPLKGLLSTGRA